MGVQTVRKLRVSVYIFSLKIVLAQIFAKKIDNSFEVILSHLQIEKSSDLIKN